MSDCRVCDIDVRGTHALSVWRRKMRHFWSRGANPSTFPFCEASPSMRSAPLKSDTFEQKSSSFSATNEASARQPSVRAVDSDDQNGGINMSHRLRYIQRGVWEELFWWAVGMLGDLVGIGGDFGGFVE